MAKDIQTETDLDAARKMLRAMRPKHFLTAIKDGPLLGIHVDVTDDKSWAEAARWIRSNNENGWNIYFSPNEVRPDFDGSKTAKIDLLGCTVLQADLDPVQVEGQSHGDAVAACRTAAQEFARDFPPNVAISSGNGVQLFWFLPDPLGIADYENLNRRLNAAANGFDGLSYKGTANADRIMRLPATLNWPSKAKLAKGYSPDPVWAELLMLEPKRTVDLEAIRALPEPPENASTGAGGLRHSDEASWPPEPPSGHLEAQHAEWEAHGTGYSALLDGSRHGGDRSASLMALVGGTSERDLHPMRAPLWPINAGEWHATIWRPSNIPHGRSDGRGNALMPKLMRKLICLWWRAMGLNLMALCSVTGPGPSPRAQVSAKC